MRNRNNMFLLQKCYVDDKNIYEYYMKNQVCDTFEEFMEIANKQIDIVMKLYNEDKKYPKKEKLIIQYESANNNFFINGTAIEGYLYKYFTRHFSEYTKFEIETIKLIDIFTHYYTAKTTNVNLLRYISNKKIKKSIKKYILNDIQFIGTTGINGLTLELENIRE